MKRTEQAGEAPAAARCPRCGYDQRGAMLAWQEQCPLEGTCAECGLAYRWAEVLHPEKFEPQWCVEFAPKERGFIRSTMSTFGRSFRPWRFWSRLSMTHPVRLRRLLSYAVFLLVISLLPYAFAQASLAIYVRHRIAGDVALLPAADAAQLRRLEHVWSRHLWDSLNAPQCVRWRHTHDLARQYQVHQERVNGLKQASLVPPIVVDHSYAAAVLEAVLLPAGASSTGTIRDSGSASEPYPPPEAIHKVASIYLAGRMRYGANQPFVTRRAPFAVAVDDYADRLREAGAVIGAGTVLLMLMAMSFVLIPATLARARVRRHHVLRVAVYSAFLLATAILFCSILGCLAILLRNRDLANAMIAVSIIVPLVGGFAWWWAAISRYLKLPHGFVVTLLLTILSCLLVAAGAYYGFGPGREML